MPPKRKTKKDDDGASKKKAKPTEKEDATESKDDKVAADVAESRGDVHIISSKACQAFAKRHLELEKLIKASKPDVHITIDVQPKLGTKPDKGSFIVEVKGKKIVDLVALPRPFEKLKALSMETVAADVVKEL